MPAKVLVIGLDAAESTLLERWVSERRLPAMAALHEQGSAYRLHNSWATLPTAVWPELTSGRRPCNGALFFPPRQLRTGEAAPRRVLPEEVDPRGFWTIASDAGKRVAAIDLPWTVPPPSLNGVFVTEWATHDRWFGTASYPGTLVEEIRKRHGDYPVHLCDDDYGASLKERARLASDLVDAVEYQTRLLLDLLGQEVWELFACAFGQFQCSGHNLWSFMETKQEVPDSVRNGIFEVFSKVDEGIAALRDSGGPGRDFRRLRKPRDGPARRRPAASAGGARQTWCRIGRGISGQDSLAASGRGPQYGPQARAHPTTAPAPRGRRITAGSARVLRDESRRSPQ